ncbi:RNA polymerase sigma-70 factor [Parabacteroides sp. Marseille-P3160]|uniref:RNA polymerase sigma-70 factor n=1 Tax=Parabacteroides sp. Marseille-P3160 TaxID=1917887 RepID=UPI0009B9475D|nr:RNA polymerase sigma-70 factor [Parabacteroides sp. Marseille-P3160]
MSDDKSLILALNRGDSNAFTLLYKKYWRQVYNFTKLYITNKNVAEEIVQEVFIKIWDSKEIIREDENFRGLLFIVTRNFIFNIYRKNVNEDLYKLTVLSAIEESYNPEEEWDAEDLKKYIDLLIEQLPLQRRLIFNLSRREYKTYREIAEQMNISEKTVENQIHEALKYLRQNILLFILFLMGN